MSSANRDNFTSSILLWMPFISFPCVIALASTSSTRLNISGKSGHQILEEEVSVFAIDYDASCGLFINGLYYVEEISFYTYFVENFYHEWMLIFVKCFLCI